MYLVKYALRSAARSSILVLAVLIGLTGCDRGSLFDTLTGIRTYPTQHPRPGVSELCPLGLAVDPVIGTFDGNAGASPDKSWLVALDGVDLHIVWPEGFTLGFEPGPVLRDDVSAVVARQGDEVSLQQVGKSDHAGTTDDPYLATGLVFNNCYLRRTS